MEGLLFFVLIIANLSPYAVAKDAECRLCPSDCTCTRTEATCTGKIPACVPSTIEQLTITDAPSLNRIDRKDMQMIAVPNLRKLRILNTGLSDIENNAFRPLEDSLEILEISKSDLSYLNSATFGGLQDLDSLKITNCKQWQKAYYSVFSQLTNLRSLDISYNDIKDMYEDTFEGLEYLQYLDLSNNPNLNHIPRTALRSLNKLKELRMNNCNLATLYPEHVSSPYYSGTLLIVDGRFNDWDCNCMCEFVQWVNNNGDFKTLNVDLGYCGSPSSLSTYNVLQVTESRACHCVHTSTVVFIVLFSLSFVVTLCCILMVFKNCCKGLCGRNEQNLENNGGGLRRGEFTNPALQPTDDVVFNRAAGTGMREWEMMDADPPTYESLSERKSQQELPTSVDNESYSEEEPPPPPYEDVSTQEIQES